MVLYNCLMLVLIIRRLIIGAVHRIRTCKSFPTNCFQGSALTTRTDGIFEYENNQNSYLYINGIILYRLFLMVGSGGIEPPKPFDNGFTDRPGSPTPAPTRILTIPHIFTFFINNFDYISDYNFFKFFFPYSFTFPKCKTIYMITNTNTIHCCSARPTTITSTVITPRTKFFEFHIYLLSWRRE